MERSMRAITLSGEKTTDLLRAHYTHKAMERVTAKSRRKIAIVGGQITAIQAELAPERGMLVAVPPCLSLAQYYWAFGPASPSSESIFAEEFADGRYDYSIGDD